MTNPTPPGQVPDALRLADECGYELAPGARAEIAAELLRLHTENEALRAQQDDAYDHGPQAETVEEAARDVGKWLNERPNRPLDLRHVAMLTHHALRTAHVQNPAEIEHVASDVSKNGPESNMAQQTAPSAACPVGNSGFDYQTAADFLNGKTVGDDAMRKFVAASRWAHDDRVGLRATLLSVRGELASREAEIALLKKALMDAEAPQPSPTAQADSAQDEPLQAFDSPRAKALMRAWEEGWAACRDAEYVGEEAQNDAFNSSHTLTLCIAEDQQLPAPQADSQPATLAAVASKAVLAAIRAANMQLVRTGDNAFMLVPYKVATAQAAGSVPAVLGDDELVRLGKSPESGLPPWGIGTTRADYLRAVRAVLAAARAPADSVLEDAARWQELREQHESDEALCCVFAPNDMRECLVPVGSLPGELDAFMDTERAARKQGANHD